jgi:hypothetical protein
VYKCDDSTSCGVGGGEVNSVRGEDVLKSGEVVVGGSTNILNADNIVPIE